MMKSFTQFKLCLLISLLSISLDGASQSSDHVPGEVIVMLQPSVDYQSLDKAIIKEFGSEFEIQHLKELSPLSNIHLFSAAQAGVDEGLLLRKLQKSSFVRAAQFNHFVQERGLPNDPQIGTQWHHVDASDNDIDSDLAWDITTGGTTANGDEIVVCVIEPGGANYNHNDLIANHWVNSNEIPNNGVDDDGNGYVDDYNGWDPTTSSDNISSGGHGTSVSGMIGAKGNNFTGGAGVNWDVKIMQVEVGSLTESNVIASYSYPQTMRNLYNTTGGSQGAFVVATNASWGIDFANPVNYPVWCAYYDDLGSVGILNCGATANNNVDIDAVGDMPTACGSDYMVAVTASNSSDQRTFSGYGATTIDLAAPGESVYLPSGSSSYNNTSGTSFASPCVAGAIALVYSAPCATLASTAISNPQLAADMVLGYIYDGVDPVASLSNETVTGGRLNVKNALDLALLSCGPPPTCDPLTITLAQECELNPSSGLVEANITVTASFDSDFCSAETICYQPEGGALVCLNLLSGTLSNTASYTLSGLSSSTTYSIYYTGADGTSATQTITTGDCSSIVAGCTDPSALNFNANADVDDGSCDYPCSDVTLSILTDCWGNEVSWEIVDDNANVVASVSNNTYANQSINTWSQCLEPGCYTFTIFDSFGDGMNGSSYSFCGVDGDYEMLGPDGEVLFEMGAANYGSQSTHTFCIEGDQTPPCAQPYPQVTGLNTTVQANGVLFSWIPIAGSIGCQVQGGVIGGGSSAITIGQPEASELFVSNNSLQAGQNYQWRVRCGCSTNPLIVGPWSVYDQFFLGAAKDNRSSASKEMEDFKIAPNPANGFTQVFINSNEALSGVISLFDVTGKLVLQQNMNLS
ncbi:MAG TPA: S8 family serine peptidase, partial [Cryomorphaceae bacterium]|nr:S8 family serine peptidase [Cryomorphaceae bacterium]